jgi:hypothetical protein
MPNYSSIFRNGLMALFTLITLYPMTVAANPDGTPSLTEDMCIICHDVAPADISNAGGAHKTDVSCVECHDGHPPMKMEIIPKCSDCHSGENHFELNNCLSCHSNPHRPREIQIGNNVTDACLSCHEAPGHQLQENQTKHTLLACSSCHQKKHGMIPNCLQCHSPHSKEMNDDTCTGCHQAHQPIPVVIAGNIPSSQCAACHEDIANMLNVNRTKHSELVCATCHQGEHKTIPTCHQCHDQPHWSNLEEKFPNCLNCHVNPHNLPQ